MKKLTKVLAVLALLTGFIGVASTQKETVQVEAQTTQTHRRVYVYLMGGWDVDQMFIHFWTDSGDVFAWTESPEMTQVVNDYYTGLYFYDLPVAAIGFLVKEDSNGSEKTSDESEDILISELFVESNYKVAAVGAWANDGVKRTVTYNDYLPLTDGTNDPGKVAAILSQIDSCSSNYASGYNAYPQLFDLFTNSAAQDVKDTFSTQTLFESGIGATGLARPGSEGQATIEEKMNYLSSRYAIDGALPSRFTESAKSSNTVAIITIGLISVSSIAGYYFLKTKKFI